MANPCLKIYKPWLDDTFITSWRAQGNVGAAAEGELGRIRMSLGKSYSTTPTSGAPRTRPRTSSLLEKSVKNRGAIMGVPFWREDAPVKPETSRFSSEEGAPSAEWANVFRSGAIGPRSQRDWRPPRPGMSDQIENTHHRGQGRGIYEAPGIALLFIATSA